MKIIQIAVSSEAETCFGDTVYALTDDGKVYKIWLDDNDREHAWFKLPDLPDDK